MAPEVLNWKIADCSDGVGRLIYPTNAFEFLWPRTDSLPLAPQPGGQLFQSSTCEDSLALPSSISDSAWCVTQPQAIKKLEVIVIGAGLGGLATSIALTLSGHKVRVFEQAPAFGEVGAGIQVPPNSTRYLLAWGVGKHIEQYISEPNGVNMRRGRDGALLGLTRLRPDFKSKYRAPYWVLHRADYHSALLARAQELGVEIYANSEVTSYTFEHQMFTPEDTTNGSSTENLERPKGSALVTFANGKSAVADLVIGADGIKSLARTTVLSSHQSPIIEPQLTGQAAYRCTVPLSVIEQNPITKWISDTPNQNLWIGPGRHAMTYPIGGVDKSRRLFNLVLSHTEPRPPEEWTKDLEETKAEMRQKFHGFEPRFIEVISILSKHPKAKVVKWPIVTTPLLPTWTHESGKLVVLGDAAHAMVPYMSQGAAMAVEDAAAIASVLSKVTSQEQIPQALNVFEKVRMQRTSGMQQASWLNGEIWHMPDGAVQEARDAAMSDACTAEKGYNANQWSDPACQAWTYGYDAVAEVQKAWNSSVRLNEA